MKSCPKCNAPNYPAQEYCGACGSKLTPLHKDAVPIHKAAISTSTVEEAFNYEPLITYYQWMITLPSIALIGVLVGGQAGIAIYGVAYLVLIPAAIYGIVLMVRNANMLKRTNPTACRNLKALIWLQFLTILLVRALAQQLGGLYFVFALAVDVAGIYMRDWVISGRCPSKVGLYRGAGNALWYVVVSMDIAMAAGRTMR